MYSQMIIVSNAFDTKYKITYSLVETAMNPGVGGGGGGGGGGELPSYIWCLCTLDQE